MWKSLRTGALLALAALGALKLAQYAAARAEMERLAGALAPAMRLGYSGVAGALDGRVILEAPRLEVLSGPARGAVLRANRATIESAGALSLLWRALTGDAAVPSALDVHLEGASFAQETVDRYAREGWFGPASLVPFESIGCEPVTTFSARDYARMGLATYPRDDMLHYRYDADARTLRTDVVSTAAPFSTITAHLELSGFAPSAWFGDARAEKALRVEQFSLTYLDGGYLARRNRFCAQLTGTDAEGYTARHLAAVQSFLAARGVTLGDDVAHLYRKLVAEGGSAELSSLPEAAFVPADFAAYAPDDLLRQLNVTVRRNTAPPILMRLGFAAPPPTPAAADVSETVAVETTTGVKPDVAPDTPADAPTDAPAFAVAEPEPAKSEGMPLLSVAHAAALPVDTHAIETPVIPTPPPADVLAVATPEAKPGPAMPVAPHPEIDPRDAKEAIPASAPPPPPDSTAALVWRAPTIERLPQKEGAESSYVAVPLATLGAHLGARVRLLTAGGKRVEGRLQRMDGADVVVLILREGGSAEMRIPQAGIRGAELRRAGSP
jgi:hypothetical protein